MEPAAPLAVQAADSLAAVDPEAGALVVVGLAVADSAAAEAPADLEVPGAVAREGAEAADLATTIPAHSSEIGQGAAAIHLFMAPSFIRWATPLSTPRPSLSAKDPCRNPSILRTALA